MEMNEIRKSIVIRNIFVFWIPILGMIAMTFAFTIIFLNIWIFVILMIVNIVLLFVLASYTHILNIKKLGFDNERIFFENQIQKKNNSLLNIIRRRPHNIPLIKEKLINKGYKEDKDKGYFSKKIVCKLWSSDFIFFPFSRYMWLHIYIDPDLNEINLINEYKKEPVGNIVIFTKKEDDEYLEKKNNDVTIVFCDDKYKIIRRSVVLHVDAMDDNYRFANLYRKIKQERVILYENTISMHSELDDLLSKL